MYALHTHVTNDEPMYSYRRGRGWVLSNEAESEIFEMVCGTKVYIDFRRPLIGERWAGALKERGGIRYQWWDFENNTPNYDVWISSFKTQKWDWLNVVLDETTLEHWDFVFTLVRVS